MYILYIKIKKYADDGETANQLYASQIEYFTIIILILLQVS